MSSHPIIEPDETRQYDLLEEYCNAKRANKIKSVNKVMSKIADKLASIEKGIAIKCKQDKIDKQVGFDLDKFKCM